MFAAVASLGSNGAIWLPITLLVVAVGCMLFGPSEIPLLRLERLIRALRPPSARSHTGQHCKATDSAPNTIDVSRMIRTWNIAPYVSATPMMGRQPRSDPDLLTFSWPCSRLERDRHICDR